MLDRELRNEDAEGMSTSASPPAFTAVDVYHRGGGRRALIVAADETGVIHVYARNGTRLRSIHVGHGADGGVTRIARAGALLAFADEQPAVAILDLSKAQVVRSCPAVECEKAPLPVGWRAWWGPKSGAGNGERAACEISAIQFDTHTPHLLHAALSDGSLVTFNTRSRQYEPSTDRHTSVCTAISRVRAHGRGTVALGITRGFLYSVGASLGRSGPPARALSVHNVSGLYGRPGGRLARLFAVDPLHAGELRKGHAAREAIAAQVATSTKTVLVSGACNGSILRLYHTSLAYKEPPPAANYRFPMCVHRPPARGSLSRPAAQLPSPPPSNAALPWPLVCLSSGRPAASAKERDQPGAEGARGGAPARRPCASIWTTFLAK